ncbi:MAG: RHS repeat-associated core domain-containing protein [Caldilineaceae bacterium]
MTVWPYTTTAVKHYSFNGMRIAISKGGVLKYVHADHLTSTSVETDGNGGQNASRSYYAYGEVRASSGTLHTDRTYTGQKADGTGLLYYNARYYNPALGTFLSPDTLVPDAGAVVDYNRFLYARGNPLKFADPSGHRPCGRICEGDSTDWRFAAETLKRSTATPPFGLSTPTERQESVEQALTPVKDFLKERVMPMTMPFPFNIIGQFTDVSVSADVGSFLSPTGVTARGGASVARDSEGTVAVMSNYGGGGSTPALSPLGVGLSAYGTTLENLKGKAVQFGGTLGEGAVGYLEVSLLPGNDVPNIGVSIGGRAERPDGIPGSIHATATQTDLIVGFNPIDWGFGLWINLLAPGSN